MSIRAAAFASTVFLATGALAAPNWQQVDAAFRRSGATQAGGVLHLAQRRGIRRTHIQTQNLQAMLLDAVGAVLSRWTYSKGNGFLRNVPVAPMTYFWYRSE